MALRQTTAIARKELREAVRDRRSLMSGLLYGIWGPMVMALALVALARDRGADAPITLTVDGGPKAAGLMSFLDARMVAAAPAADGPSRDGDARSLPDRLLARDGGLPRRSRGRGPDHLRRSDAAVGGVRRDSEVGVRGPRGPLLE